MLSVLVLATAEVVTEVATVKLVTSGISSAIAVYVATRPRAYQRRRTSKNR